jgi:3-hydroxyisobutyrate dehydrogenase-like beta-hydroxyacid dehydrogenase
MTGAAVALVGLGRMGDPMARTLLGAGVPLTIWNRTVERARALEPSGARVAGSPEELASVADVVVSMVAGDAAAEQVHAALLQTARPGTVILEMSTLGVPCVLRLGERAARAGVAVVDAPVSGSTSAAASGQLVALVGGEHDAIARAMPVLGVLTRSQHLLGPRGAGSAMKLVLNAMLAVTNQALGEALLLAVEAGLAPAAAYDAIADSAVASPFVVYKRDAFLQPEQAPVAFTAQLMLKDVELALALARSHGLAPSLTSEARAALARVVDRDLGHLDIARVAASVRDLQTTDAP